MQKSSFLMLAMTIIAALGVFYMPAKDFQGDAESLYLYKVEFENFKDTFNKQYEIEEQAFRFMVFKQNIDKINAHNADSTQSYSMGITPFVDFTHEQFVEKILVNDLINMKNTETVKVSLEGVAPSDIDWRDKGVMTPVKNQGQCGSCWAFSTTATLESAVAISKKSLNSFSEQQLVDCCGDKGYKCQGCSGAWPEWAMDYIKDNGIVLETEYKYTARKGTCQATPTAKKYLNTGKAWTQLNSGDDIKKALASTGPVSICIDASNWSMYRSGVFSNCGTKTLNHAVTAIGYDSTGNWIVRNSWGTSWGENGFIRLAPGNTCGITQHALVTNVA